MECISIDEKIKFIENSISLEQVQKSGILPDPDAQKGYYFISYSHKDYKIVFRHVLRLLEQGVNLWYDRGLEAGKSWRDDVKKKIYSYNCKGVICFLSSNCFGSESLLQEYDMIYRFSKPMVTVSMNASIFDPIIKAFGDNVDEKLFESWLRKLSEITDEFPALPNGEKVSKDVEILLMAIAKIKRKGTVYENSTVEEFVKVLKSLPRPKLLRYKVRSNEQCVMVTGINDISVRTLKIPAYHGKHRLPVGGVESGGLANCAFLEEVFMPDTWHWILWFSFYNCKNLRKIDFGKPQDGRIIYVSAFDGCKSLTNLIIPGVHTVGVAQYIETITFTDEATFILEGSKKLREVQLESAYEIWDKALAECESLEYFTIPSNCQKIGDSAFSHTALKYLRFPEEVKSIGANACLGCRRLENIDIACKMVVIGERAFCKCIALKKIRINNVIRLNSKAFYGCKNLSEVTIIGKEVNVYVDVFGNCPSLKKIVLDLQKLNCLEEKDGIVCSCEPIVKELFSVAETIYLKRGADFLNLEGFVEELSDMEGYRFWRKE